MITPLAFMESVSGYAQSQYPDQKIRLGTIDSGYTIADWLAGTLPKVIFDGEAALSGKRYPITGDYCPHASDRVVLIPVGGTYAIIGRIGIAGGNSEWVSKTPAWTSTGIQPAIVNGTATGRYRRVSGTRQIQYEFAFTMGAGTTYGTGYYFHDLPVAASASSIVTSIGCAYLLDGGTADRPGAVHITSASQVEIISSSGHCTPTVPWTWATGDVMIARIEYEAAA